VKNPLPKAMSSKKEEPLKPAKGDGYVFETADKTTYQG
jgi:hypothetical protein